jgi:DNA modification methylase
MKKEKDGVLNDNLNFDDLLDFNKKWIPLSFMNTKSNGSWYCWGIDEPLMDIYSEILKPMQNRRELTFRNYITWDKGFAQGQMSEGQYLFAKSTEKCLFVMCGNATMSSGQFRTKEFFFEGFAKLRDYLRSELEKSGVTQREIVKITNTASSHYFSESQWQFPTEVGYNTIKHYCQQKHSQVFQKEYQVFQKEYQELQKEYQELQKEYQELLPYFDNTHDNMNEVWQFARTSKKERDLCGEHATPKPIELCSRAIKSSSRINERVLDLFGGSGSTLIACEQLNRKCYMMELDEHYCDVIIDRWQKLTGKTAVKIEQQ